MFVYVWVQRLLQPKLQTHLDERCCRRVLSGDSMAGDQCASAEVGKRGSEGFGFWVLRVYRDSASVCVLMKLQGWEG